MKIRQILLKSSGKHLFVEDVKTQGGCIYIYICMFLDQGPKVPPQWYPPPPPKPRGGGLPFFLSLFFPSLLLPFPFSFLPSKLCQQHITTTGGRRCFATLLQSSKPHLFIEPFLLLIFSLNPFCFYIHSSKLDICSCNLYRALVIDNHHTTTPHHSGEGGGTMTIGGGSLRSCNIYIYIYIQLFFFLVAFGFWWLLDFGLCSLFY